MHTFRVTVITAEGQRLELPFLAASQQQVHERLDELFPERRMSSCICTSQQRDEQQAHPDRLHRVVRLLAAVTLGAACLTSCGGGDPLPEDCATPAPLPPGTKATPPDPCRDAAR